MTEITTQELLSLCQFINGFPPPFYPVVAQFVSDLYTTGCRPTELIEVNRWSQSVIDIDYYTMQPQKGNNTREIAKAILSKSLITAITNQTRPYNHLSIRQLEYSMKQIIPVGKMQVESKEMVSYIFRYNRVKQLLGAGATNEQVQTFFGWLNPPMPWNYNSKKVLVQFPNIPASTNFIMDANTVNIIDADGTFLISQ